MKKIEEVCRVENIVDYILTSKKYKRFNPYQKEQLVLQLFHSVNWDKVRKEDRVILLQEIENIEAKKLHREPFEFVILRNDYKWNEFLMDFYINKQNKKIYSRKNYIEEGIYQKVEDGKIREGKRLTVNFDLLDCMFHEQYHIMTHHYIKKLFMSSPTMYREHAEFLIWYSSSATKLDYNNLEMMKNRLYVYRMFPDEYYAYFYAEQKIKDTFAVLNQYYGIDANFELYLMNTQKEREHVVSSYIKDHDDVDAITYDELYQKCLNGYIHDYAEEENKTPQEVEKQLCLKRLL